MGDAVRPSEDRFNQTLQDSLHVWSSYLSPSRDNETITRQAIELENLVANTPTFLGDGITSTDEDLLFACEEKHIGSQYTSLFVDCQSTWTSSRGTCDLPPRVLSKQLLLAVGSRLSVTLTEDAPLSHWPGVQGLPGYDEGNFLLVLYLAWAYILSARWVELLNRSSDHESRMSYSEQGMENSSQWQTQSMIHLDLGSQVSTEEILWWRSILRAGVGWDATTKYNSHIYLSPWSISLKDANVTPATEAFPDEKSEPPNSTTALHYLSRFCSYHRLYAQCSVALAGVLFIPFLGKKVVTLPIPKPPSLFAGNKQDYSSNPTITELFNNHNKELSQYMTLSSNCWGLRSLLGSTFFNPSIDCNLVSAWLNPAFALLDPITSEESSLVVLLTNRKPRLGILWLGAILGNVAKSVLRDLRTGSTALDLPASAWTRTTHTFLTSPMGDTSGECISRDDECRLLFITSHGIHKRPPIWPWKPFGTTRICDTELPVQQHSQCGAHCVEYASWEWLLKNGKSIRDPAKEIGSQPLDPIPQRHTVIPSELGGNKHDLFSHCHSEIATRGIFGWMRMTGYPLSERQIYQHSWIDLEDTDEDEPEVTESDKEAQRDLRNSRVENWLDNLDRWMDRWIK